MSVYGTYYQFNIDLQGNYIRGYMTSKTPNDGFFRINQPFFSNEFLKDLFKSNNGTISLSQNLVVCYFEIKED